jgi:predicted GTPase
MIDENYKRYLENKVRSHFGFTGTPIILSFKKKN